MKKPGILREIYLRSIPSVDLDLVPEGEQVDCCEHTMKMSVYEQLLEEFCENKDEEVQVGMLMLMSGPQLVQG